MKFGFITSFGSVHDYIDMARDAEQHGWDGVFVWDDIAVEPRDVFDPWVCGDEARHEYGLEPIGELSPATYDAVVLAVAHREFAALGAQGIRALTKAESIVYDVKHVLPKATVDGRL